MIDGIHKGAPVVALEPLSALGIIGIILLGISVVRAGAPRRTAAAIVVGSLGRAPQAPTGYQIAEVAAVS